MSLRGSDSSIADVAGRVLGRRPLERLTGALQPGRELTFEHLVLEVDPVQPEALAAALAMLVRQGAVRQIVRIESPLNHGGIADFASVQEIPDEIYDWRADQTLHVQPENLRVIFSLR
jgi:hypothetical protein